MNERVIFYPLADIWQADVAIRVLAEAGWLLSSAESAWEVTSDGPVYGLRYIFRLA